MDDCVISVVAVISIESIDFVGSVEFVSSIGSVGSVDFVGSVVGFVCSVVDGSVGGDFICMYGSILLTS